MSVVAPGTLTPPACVPSLPYPAPCLTGGQEMGGGQLNKPGIVKGSACLCLLSGHGDTWGIVGFHPQCSCDYVTACTCPVCVQYVLCMHARMYVWGLDESLGPYLALQRERRGGQRSLSVEWAMLWAEVLHACKGEPEPR